MRKLLKSFKTEINPTEEQKVKIRKTIGTCRFIYNFYLAHNKELHESGKKFMSSSQFRVWLNNEFLLSHPEYSWIKEAYSKSVTQAANNSSKGIGIDLGLKDFAIVSNGKTYKNINKSARLKKLEKKLAREQRGLSRKYENLKKGGSTQKRNIQKQRLKIQKLHHRIDNIRTDYINKTIAEIVKTKPSYITIEDLNVSGMMKNRHLSKAVASQKFYEFKTKLEAKCRENGIELRIVDRWFPSSKTCHCCKSIKKDLKLSDRIFRCDCGYIEDRDFNAALNLRDATTYEVA